MGAGTAALFALHGARVTLVVRRSAGPQLGRSGALDAPNAEYGVRGPGLTPQVPAI